MAPRWLLSYRVKALHSCAAASLIAACITASPVCANAPFSLVPGLLLECNLYNQPGISMGYSDTRFLGNRPRASLSYTTSRLQALGSYVLKKDNYAVSLGWFFRPDKIIDPYITIDAGVTHFDLEDDVLFSRIDNTSPLLALDLGLSLNLWERRVMPWAHIGYSFLTSSSVNPLVISFGCATDISRGIWR